ncbi:MAG: hypothetical protein CMI21_06320 [Opitutae bacterium]|nr:hypothetical protein [Opitutae bacterium]|tara:strand:- start:1936 stop:2964 length:1029 start_codon:yes stop_codon:yes gene_type:complete
MGNPLLKTLLKTLLFIVVLVLAYEVAHLLWLGQSDGWSSLSWVEGVSDDGPSTKARDEDVGRFEKVISFDGETSSPLLDLLILSSVALAVVSAWLLWGRAYPPRRSGRWRKVFAGSLAAFVGATILGLSGVFGQSKETGDAEWRFFTDRLEVGDVIAYRKEKWNARRQLFAEGKLSVIGYRLFKYGHLAIVVEDPDKPGRKVLFTSAGGKGVNLDEGIDSLRTYNWDAYRLDKWDRIDPERIREGIRLCREKSGHFFGYDFTGMLALWNEDLKPEEGSEFGSEYICSTAVVTLLYYGGFESDAAPRRELDLVTPFQVVRAKGRFVVPPELPGSEEPEETEAP